MNKMIEEIRKKLNELSDLKYKEFHSSLCPNTSCIIGVRVPKLREYAKELYNTYSVPKIEIGDYYYEELVLQGMIIGLQKNEKIEVIQEQIENFVPKINSWAVCDTFCAGLKITKKHKKEILKIIKKYLKSSEEYEIRFAIVMLLDYYIENEHIDEILEILENVRSNKYYVQMAVAWAYSVCLIKYYDKTIEALNKAQIDKFTYNKSLQKAIESFRITDFQKDELRKMKMA